MAKIHTEIVVIKLSKLIRDDAAAEPIASDDLIDTLQQLAEELAGTGVIVETERS
jgi:hypothetical protein